MESVFCWRASGSRRNSYHTLRENSFLTKGLNFGQRHALSVPRKYLMSGILSDGALLRTMVIVAKLRKGGKPDNNGDSSFRNNRPFANGGSGFSSPVPLEQQPVNEYQNLVDSVLFSWAVGDLWLYMLKLSAIGAAVTLFLGWPVMAYSMDPDKEFIKCSTGALCSGLLAVTLTVLRMYLGWAYVGNRLLSATVEYEETGWYDGEIWIKPPEVLTRDRLLGSYKVKPALSRVRYTLIGLAASLVTCTVLFLALQGTDSGVDLVQDSSESSSNQPVGGAYSDESAHRFEPEAFAIEDESTMPSYCR